MAQHSTENSRLGGLPALPQEGSGESYTEGGSGLNAGLADALVETYAAAFGLSRDFSRGDFMTVRDAIGLVALPDVADPQGFLDAVVDGLLERGAASDYAFGHHTFHLLSPLISRLYALGCSMLELDASGFTCEPRLVADHIEASSGRPFLFTYTPLRGESGISYGIGNSSRWCSVHVRGGANTVGFYAEHCTFFLDEMPAALGDGSSGSAYCLADARDVTFLPDPISEHNILADVLTPAGRRCLDLRGRFFGHGNSLLIPDGAGSWTEVRP